jgi:hypothetical protein
MSSNTNLIIEDDEVPEKFTMDFIKNNPDFICRINTFIKLYDNRCKLGNLTNYVRYSCPELNDYYFSNKDKFKSKCKNDKGIFGKLVEFEVFGNLPNSNSAPDLSYADIKVTKFKKLKNDGYNAKERLTLTNIGDPNNEDTIKMFNEFKNIKELKYYQKIKSGILIVMEHDAQKYDTIEQCYDKKILCILLYDLDELPEEDKMILNDDYNKIRDCIINKCVSQSGQKYLHIHKHGSKNSNTRAFGFTPKFITKLVSFYLKIPLQTKANSSYLIL